MVVCLLCFPNIEIDIYLLIPEETCPLFRIVDDIDFNAIIVVSPGLYVAFQ